MFGSEILEVAVGIFFIFALVSIICTAIQETIEAFLKKRARYLEDAIRELLHDKKGDSLAEAFYKHPVIYSLFSSDYKPSKFPRRLSTGWGFPSYIPARNFASAILDIAARGEDPGAANMHPPPVISTDAIRRNIAKNIPIPEVQRVLLLAVDSAQGDLNKARENVEAWFDSVMDRAAGWYKRSSQQVILLIAIVMAVGMNINTLTLVDYLYSNKTQRAFIIATVEKRTAQGSVIDNAAYDSAKKQIDTLKLPIGWPSKEAKFPCLDGAECGSVIFGWLLTAIAASLGAPFWFDLLNKVMVIRSTVKPHEKSPEEASEDRQRPAPSGGAAAAAQPVQSIAVAPLAGQMNFAPVAAPLTHAHSPNDMECGIDGCDAAIDDITLDEELPAAKGGVAP